ncbi:hypothetical protein YWIDRAFT_00423 [Streptomyces sp. SceaMP-e96]|uniref:hypothetical protein n=1 Tax=unclassified Streptomyces TaxID=2593676 RepID=UPI000823D860|nr:MULTISPECIES: hypothetical protein [unclassified Streptomyces]MYT11232.1 hypothetical protein [Streptomyces sp. SID4951]SCK07785.1 hypothetical protein YWIDRAFT_00423 [Streptomyces sp. SceaMP-e96]
MPITSDPLPTIGGRAVGIFGLLVALGICGVSGSQAAVASGLLGTAGKLTVSECHSGGGGRGGMRHCYGTFHPAEAGDSGGLSSDPRARVNTQEAEPGDTLQVRKGSAGYVVAGMGAAWVHIAFAFLGLLIGSAALPVTASGVLPRRGTGQDLFAAVRGTRLAWIAKRLALMSTAGIAVSAYLAWLF